MWGAKRWILKLIFFRAALDIALEHLNGTEQRFKNGIEQMALKAIASTANEEKNESKREEDQYQPPLGLLDFIPLAELCNSILSRYIADFIIKSGFMGYFLTKSGSFGIFCQ